MARRTPAAKALVGCLALRDGATTNQAFRLAGYRLERFAVTPDGWSTVRRVVRGGRLVTITRNAHVASAWLTRLGRKLEALMARKAAA
jgi:hypothetical protein